MINNMKNFTNRDVLEAGLKVIGRRDAIDAIPNTGDEGYDDRIDALFLEVDRFECVGELLIGLFMWANTRQGYLFWCELHGRLSFVGTAEVMHLMMTAERLRKISDG